MCVRACLSNVLCILTAGVACTLLGISYVLSLITVCLFSIPDHIKKAVLKYVVLTNVEPNVHLGGNDDLPTRMKAEEESYPLEKAVFVPRELLDKYGCGQLYIRRPHEREHDQAHEQCADQCDDMYGQWNTQTHTHKNTCIHTHTHAYSYTHSIKYHITTITHNVR